MNGQHTLRLERSDTRRRLLIQHKRTGCSCIDNGVLVIGMNRALGSAHKARTHLDRLSAQCKCRGHATTVADPSRSNQGNVDFLADGLQQDQGGNFLRILEATTFSALHNESIDARIHALLSQLQRWNRMVDGNPSALERRNKLGGTTRRSAHPTHAALTNKLQHRVVFEKPDGQIDAKRQPGSPHDLDLSLAGLRLARGGFDHAQPPGSRHCQRQLRTGDPAHGGLNDGKSGARMGEDSVHFTLPETNPARRWPIIAFASTMIRSISSLTVGISWIKPATMPQDQAPASISPSVMMRG